MNHKLDAAQAAIGYRFTDTSLLWEALQAAGSGASIISGMIVRRGDGNKKLALIGDAVLKLVVICDLREHGADRETVSRVLSTVLTNSSMNDVGRLAGLDAAVEGDPAQQGMVSPRTMADTVEAIIGAVHLDDNHGEDAVRSVMQALGLTNAVAEAIVLLGGASKSPSAAVLGSLCGEPGMMGYATYFPEMQV